MARAARRNGADVRLTIDPDVHHEAWEKAYASDAMWEWLLAQKKTDKDDQTVARKHLAAARRSGFRLHGAAKSLFYIQIKMILVRHIVTKN